MNMVEIDMCRCRELVAHIANGREPNWRAMSTSEGRIMQDYLRTLWERHRQVLGDYEVLMCAAQDAAARMSTDEQAAWADKYSEVIK
jgi:hypothetical protein